ncbi:BACON domain-containing protein [Bacteroides sp. 519]|uniref:BACON domain-containing protein n=1 Tax=Bacteroides sp. 519 TaxID=2302937 RepID=UPI0013D0BD30|nr:BACON domain-containing protein [Bacteroides sp. 519]NDV57866.1 hypothetical protein [Bacteroides sp. 519]
MRRHILLFLLLIVTGICFSQNCYNDTRSKGISLYNQSKYKDAISVFEAAKDCPDKPIGNDLQSWIQKCNTGINNKEKAAEKERLRQIELEKEREREKEKQRENEKVLAAKGFMDIKDIEFANEDSVKIISNYGSRLYASDIKYLKARIIYNGLTDKPQKITIYKKIYKPDGSLSTGTSSPSGYTSSDDINVTSGTNSTIALRGWGTKTGGTYRPGDYRYEIWYEGKMLFSKTFTLYKKNNEVTYLKVNNATSVSTTAPSSENTISYSVSTDADKYTLWGIPSWCSLENRTSNSFVLRLQKNTSSSERKDYLEVRADNKKVRIDIIQKGDDKSIGKIESVWVDFDQYNSNYVKGMLIHVKFSANNMLGKRGRCVAYFHFKNGDKLLDYNQSYRTTDGQVSVSDNFTPEYVNTIYNDFTLFMPYSELHIQSGQKNVALKFNVQIYEEATRKFIANSDYVNFTFSN